MQKRHYLFYLIIVFFFIFGCNKKNGNCILINKSTQEISKIKIIVCKQNFSKTNFKPGESVKLNFHICADSSYNIDIEFANGKNLNKEMGYITNNVIVEDAISIYDNDLSFEKYLRSVEK